MSVKDLISVGLLIVVPAVAEAQPPTDTAAVPRTTWGAPDLQGVWDFNTRTPLERRGTAAETPAADQDAQPDWRRIDIPPAGSVGAYNGFWVDTPTARNERTSQIVDPPDGRVPPLMPGVPVQVGSLWADLPGHRPVRYRSGGIAAADRYHRRSGIEPHDAAYCEAAVLRAGCCDPPGAVPNRAMTGQVRP